MPNPNLFLHGELHGATKWHLPHEVHRYLFHEALSSRHVLETWDPVSMLDSSHGLFVEALA